MPPRLFIHLQSKLLFLVLHGLYNFIHIMCLVCVTRCVYCLFTATSRQALQQLSFSDILLSHGLVDITQLVHIFNDSYTLTDPSQPDNPICWCSPGFTSLTGYKQEELIGRNCRFLQGVDCV